MWAVSEQEEAKKAAKCVEHVAEWMETASEQEVASLVQETVTKVKRGEQLLIADISFAVLCLFGVVC